MFRKKLFCIFLTMLMMVSFVAPIRDAFDIVANAVCNNCNYNPYVPKGPSDQLVPAVINVAQNETAVVPFPDPLSVHLNNEGRLDGNQHDEYTFPGQPVYMYYGCGNNSDNKLGGYCPSDWDQTDNVYYFDINAGHNGYVEFYLDVRTPGTYTLGFYHESTFSAPLGLTVTNRDGSTRMEVGNGHNNYGVVTTSISLSNGANVLRFERTGSFGARLGGPEMTLTLNTPKTTNNADLVYIGVNNKAIENFNAATLTYNVNIGVVENNIPVNIAALPVDAYATITGTDPIIFEDNTTTKTVNIVVKSSDNSVTKTYTVNITRELPGPNADVTKVTVGGAEATLNITTGKYEVNIGMISPVTLAVTTKDPNAQVTGAGSISFGATEKTKEVTFKVTSTVYGQTAEKDYAIVINRIDGSLANIIIDGTPIEGFDTNVFEYNVTTDRLVDEVTLTAVPSNSSVVISGTNPVTINVADYQTHTHTFTVSYGGVSKTYTVRLTRAPMALPEEEGEDYSKWAFIANDDLLWQLCSDGSPQDRSWGRPPKDEVGEERGYFTADNSPYLLFGWEELAINGREESENYQFIANAFPNKDVTDIVISNKMIMNWFYLYGGDANGDPTFSISNRFNNTEKVVREIRRIYPNASIHILGAMPLTANAPRLVHLGNNANGGGMYQAMPEYPNLNPGTLSYGDALYNRDTGKAFHQPEHIRLYNDLQQTDLYDVRLKSGNDALTNINYIDLTHEFFNITEANDLVYENGGYLKEEYSSKTSYGYHLNKVGIAKFGDALVKEIRLFHNPNLTEIIVNKDTTTEQAVPDFDGNSDNKYNMHIESSDTTATITGKPLNEGATYEPNVVQLPLYPDYNRVQITSTAEDGINQKVYTIDIRRDPILEVTVTWEDLSFDYRFVDWDEDAHVYTQGEFAPSVQGQNYVNVINRSEVPMTLDFGFSFNEPGMPDYSAIAGGYITKTNSSSAPAIVTDTLPIKDTAGAEQNYFVWLRRIGNVPYTGRDVEDQGIGKCTIEFTPIIPDPPTPPAS